MTGEIITIGSAKTRDGSDVEIYKETDDYIIGAYYSEDGRAKGWIPVRWPKYTPYYNGRCESGLDLLRQIELNLI